MSWAPTGGAERMRALAADLPNSLLAGFRAGRELAFPNDGASRGAYAVGTGGCGLAADLARVLLDAETMLSLRVVRGAELPRAVANDSRAILVSVSGEDAECLAAYDAAGRAGAHRRVVTSGGELAERAERDGVPVLGIPPGIPSRAAVGHLVGGMLGLLDASFPESNDSRVARLSERLRPAIGLFARADGPASSVADRISDRIPFVAAEPGFSPVARHWASQIAENAQRLAVSDELSDLVRLANDGWRELRPPEGRGLAVVMLDWSGAEPTARRLGREAERRFTARSIPVARVPLAPEDRLEALFYGLAFGDQVSFALAQRGHVGGSPDPGIPPPRASPVAEARLRRPSHRASSRSAPS
jgi:glucose/mannose-6-phosphate isomerase